MNAAYAVAELEDRGEARGIMPRASTHADPFTNSYDHKPMCTTLFVNCLDSGN